MVIGLLGHGIIGIGVDRIIRERTDMKVKKILSLVVDEEMEGRTAKDIDDIVTDPEIDTVVEVMGGIHPAFEFISAAMEHGKNVVTANKAVVAACYKELVSLSLKTGVSFRCTAAAGGSIPWLFSLERAKRVDRILSVGGIMNGTTNFILDAMNTRGGDFDSLIKEAQELGYAESNPEADIKGYDIRRKLNISVNVAFDVLTDENAIPCFGIDTVLPADIRCAKALGCTLKYVAAGKKNDDGSVTAFVEPVFVKNSDPMASLSDSYNLVKYTGTNASEQSFIGMGAGRFPTAFNVVQDLVDVLERKPGFYTSVLKPAEIDNTKTERAYYIRTACPDAFLEGITEGAGEGYILTKKVPVAALHAWAKNKLIDDPALFIAGLE